MFQRIWLSRFGVTNTIAHPKMLLYLFLYYIFVGNRLASGKTERVT